MKRPVLKLRPKKVSAIEPPSMDFALFAKLDIIHRISGDREFAHVPQPDWVIERPDLPKPPKKVTKKKKKKGSKIVRVVTERIEKAASDSENSDDDNTTKKKARSNNLPPPEILFAHLNRVETMKS